MNDAERKAAIEEFTRPMRAVLDAYPHARLLAECKEIALREMDYEFAAAIREVISMLKRREGFDE